MKIVHTGDWHIGKVFNQTSLIDDQAYVLEQLVQLLAEEKPDVLIIAGDVYDRAVPGVEAVDLVDDVLSRILLDLRIPVLVVAGNHDSPDRLGFGSRLLTARRLYIAGRGRRDIAPVVLTDEYGPVYFYLLPYVPPPAARDVLGRDNVRDHDGAMAAWLENIHARWDPAARNVLVTHGFVRGRQEPVFSESERPLSLEMVGGMDYIDVTRFAGFCYTALGHLHGPQQAGSERARYAGSLLKYSFSEAEQEKSLTMLEIDQFGRIFLSTRSLTPRRDVRCLRGKLADLLNPAVYKDTNVDDYVRITLTDEGKLYEPMQRLRAVYPHVLELAFDHSRHSPQMNQSRTAADEGYRQKSKLDLFADFYAAITGRDFTAEKAAVVEQAVAAAENAEEEM